MATQISKYFTLEELVASNEATKHGITANFNPSPSVVANLTALAVNVLDAVRELIGMPLSDSSGYRCPELNTMEGGMPNSQHLFGEAADIYCALTPDELYAKIKASNIIFDELIIEHDSHGNRWVHISFDPNKVVQRGLCMKGELQPGGGTICVSDGFGAFKNAA